MRSRSATVLIGVLVFGLSLGGCGAAKQKALDRALEDTPIELDGLGKKIPSSFPTEVPLPAAGAALESALGVGELYTMRYTISDPRAASDAYRDALAAAGFTIESEFDHLGDAGNNTGFTATDGSWSVTSTSFGPDPVDGLYQAVVVEPEI